MKTELYRSFKSIDPLKLTEEDKKDLLKIFDVVDNILIRDHVAFIFSDAKYHAAVPNIIEKINDKRNLNNNGSLVYALTNLNVDDFYLDIINIICTMEYEARLEAYEIINDKKSNILPETKKKALAILMSNLSSCREEDAENYENSTKHFIESTIKILQEEL